MAARTTLGALAATALVAAGCGGGTRAGTNAHGDRLWATNPSCAVHPHETTGLIVAFNAPEHVQQACDALIRTEANAGNYWVSQRYEYPEQDKEVCMMAHGSSWKTAPWVIVWASPNNEQAAASICARFVREGWRSS
jgi:hypothetical protein